MSEETGYRPLRTGRKRVLDIREVRYNVTEWGDPAAPTFIYLHGWADTSETFQFVIDALQDEWYVVAPDWRGFGRSAVAGTSYWFPDYLADLHVLLDTYFPDEPARLVGHSMGGNVAALYAGTMPERVRALVNIEGFGLRDSSPDDAPSRYRQWLQQMQAGPSFSTYPDLRKLAVRIAKRHPLLTPERAAFVARAWAREREDGRVALRADPLHKLPNPVLYRRAEAAACWRAITADVLHIAGDTGKFAPDQGDAPLVTIDGAGHMLHFDAPERLAASIEDFLRKYL